MTERTQEGTGISLQCPECGHSLERTVKAYSCPGGHVELQVKKEGCPVLKEPECFTRSLSYGGDFKEGVLWQRTLSRYKKVVYLTSSEDKENDLKPLREYLTALKCEFRVIYLDGSNKLNTDRETLIVFSPRIGRKNVIKIILKHIYRPVYRYVNGSVIRVQLIRIINQVVMTLLHKLLFDPIISRSIETRYERYLSDQETAKRFARTYLPLEMQNGEGRQVLDIGCGRGRHVAMLNQLGFTVTGMDVQRHPYWGRISNADFIIGSAECLPYIPDSSFDLIVCMQVLMYLKNDDLVLAQIRRILKREGYLLLQVTNKENLHTFLTNQPLTQDPFIQRYYKESELCSKLQERGFTIDRVWTEKFYTPFFILPGNLFYEFVLPQTLQAVWDKLIPSQHLGMINILAKPFK